jgi:hypothetical protein
LAPQITMDSPPFEFLDMSGQLTVISLPERFPVISGFKGQVPFYSISAEIFSDKFSSSNFGQIFIKTTVIKFSLIMDDHFGFLI